MIPFFTLLLCAVAFCVGVYALTREGSIFGKVQKVVRSPSGELRFVLAKPLSECLTCTSSFYGMFIYGTYFGYKANFNLIALLLFALVLLAIVGETFSKTQAYKQACQKMQICFYVLWIAYCSFVLYEERFFGCIMFLICLSGMNYFVDCVLASMKSEIQYYENINTNQIDQAQAVEEICEAIRSINKKIKK